MKKLLILTIYIISSNISYSQMIVSDPAVSANLKILQKTQISSYAKAVASLQEMNKMRAQYDKVISNVETVSSYVSSGKQVVNIKRLISEITSEYSKGVAYTSREPVITSPDKAKFNNAYRKMLNESLEDLEYSLKVIGDGNLKMNDAERLGILGSIESKMEKKKDLMIYFNNKIKKSVATQKHKQKKNEYIMSGAKSLNGN